MDKEAHSEEERIKRPTPEDFDRYLPWACGQVQANAEILITKIIQSEYVSAVVVGERSKIKKKSKTKSSKTDLETDTKEDMSHFELQAWNSINKVVKIYAIYDYYDNLVHLKFDNNFQIPRVVMKVLGMIIKFHPNLTGITINRGCSASILYELYKTILFSNITDICLDNTFITEANYHIILEGESNLRQLSLARCKLDDAVIKNIASKLVYPLPASKTLYILNLSSNRITDEGARDLGEALRSNKKLSYLNLADNVITDIGAETILNSLEKFPMTWDEIMAGRKRHIPYLKEKSELINRMTIELKSAEFDKRISRKKSTRAASMTPQKKNKLEKEPSLKTITYSKSLTNIDAILYDKAIAIAENIIGDYQDPFSSGNITIVDDIVYCLGNNTLSYLNLA